MGYGIHYFRTENEVWVITEGQEGSAWLITILHSQHWICPFSSLLGKVEQGMNILWEKKIKETRVTYCICQLHAPPPPPSLKAKLAFSFISYTLRSCPSIDVVTSSWRNCINSIDFRKKFIVKELWRETERERKTDRGCCVDLMNVRLCIFPLTN